MSEKGIYSVQYTVIYIKNYDLSGYEISVMFMGMLM